MSQGGAKEILRRESERRGPRGPAERDPGISEKRDPRALAERDPAGLEERDLGNLEAVRAIFVSLSKYILGKKIYTSNNPNLARFAESFKSACAAYFAGEEALVLDIDQYRIAWRGETVYENTKRDESIAFILFKDGVGELRIEGAATFEELDRFAEIIKDETHNYSPEQDVVTKLWEADFAHIRYRVFDESFSVEPGEVRCAAPESPGLSIEADDHDDLPSFTDKGRILAGSYVPCQSVAEYFMETIEGSNPGARPEEREMILQEMLDSYLGMSGDESAYLNETLVRERSADRLVAFVTDVLDFARASVESATARDFQGIIECLIQYIVDEREVPVLTGALEALRRFVRSHTIPDDSQSFFAGVEELLIGDAVLRDLGGIAQRSRKDAEDVFRYYALVGKRALPALSALLEDPGASWIHAEVCRTIMEVSGADIHEVINQLDIDKPRIAQGVVSMFRALRPKEVPALVNELVYYPDASVKEEVIRLLVDTGTERAARMFVKLLDDEDRHVRMKALSAAEGFSHPIVAGRIESLAFEPDLERRTMEEQERIFRALGRLAGASVLPRIRDMLLEKGFFLRRKRSADKRKKMLAIRALEQIRDDGAVSLLAALLKDPDALVKSLAQRAHAALSGRNAGQRVQGKRGDRSS